MEKENKDLTTEQAIQPEPSPVIDKNTNSVSTDKKILTKESKSNVKTKTKKNKLENKDLNGEIIAREEVVVPKFHSKAKGIKLIKEALKYQKKLTSQWSKQILSGKIVSTTGNLPDIKKNVIELYNVKKDYITGDVVTPVLKGVNLKLPRASFLVILGPSGSGKTTLLNIISGLDKVNSGDVYAIGNNLSLLKDSHLTRFRRENVGFIFQQYNLLTNLTAKENAEVGANLSKSKNPDMTIEDIFKTIGMTEQMNKYPHQMSGGQQQRVSIARALAKNPDILFGDEPTGALDEEMGRKVLEILVEINRKYKTTVIVVTHNPNIAKIANTVIHVKNGLIDSISENKNPAKPSEIDWS